MNSMYDKQRESRAPILHDCKAELFALLGDPQRFVIAHYYLGQFTDAWLVLGYDLSPYMRGSAADQLAVREYWLRWLALHWLRWRDPRAAQVARLFESLKESRGSGRAVRMEVPGGDFGLQ